MENFDHGIIPALNTTLKKEFSLNNMEMGSLGSMVYLGNMIGSIFGMPAFRCIKTKYILVSALVCQVISLIAFTVSNAFSAQQFSRMLTGMTQVIYSIYIPIWVDMSAPHAVKSKWMTILISGVTMGMLLGYILAAFVIAIADWRWAFYVQISAVVPLIIAVTFVRSRDLDVTQEAFKKTKPTEAAKRSENQIADNDNNSASEERQKT